MIPFERPEGLIPLWMSTMRSSPRLVGCSDVASTFVDALQRRARAKAGLGAGRGDA